MPRDGVSQDLLTQAGTVQPGAQTSPILQNESPRKGEEGGELGG